MTSLILGCIILPDKHRTRCKPEKRFRNCTGTVRPLPQFAQQLIAQIEHKETTPTAIGGLVKKHSTFIISRFEKFVNSNYPTLFDRGKGGKMRNRIKARLAELGLRSRNLINELQKSRLRVLRRSFLVLSTEFCTVRILS